MLQSVAARDDVKAEEPGRMGISGDGRESQAVA